MSSSCQEPLPQSHGPVVGLWYYGSVASTHLYLLNHLQILFFQH